MSWNIMKEYTFEAAHILDGHIGKCSNLHGHSYEVYIGIAADKLIDNGSAEGMILDYSHLDEIVKPIINTMDHSFLWSGSVDGVEYKIVEECWKNNKKTTTITKRTTSENIVDYIFSKIKMGIESSMQLYGFEEFEIEIWLKETKKSCCKKKWKINL